MTPRLYAIINRNHSQTELGPFQNEEARNAGVKQHFTEESADPGSDALLFAELDDEFGWLNTCCMDMQDFMPGGI